MPTHKNTLYRVLKKYFSIALVIIACLPAMAQTYTPKDSARIYAWLNQADEEAVTGSLDSAMVYARQALQTSRKKKMLRGEGFARLKMADISIQQDSHAEVND